MTQKQNLETLLTLKYQKQAHDFQKLLARETALRIALKNLRDDQTRQRPAVIDHQPMLSMGGDIAWKIWAGQKMRDINLELARILALKEHHSKAVKTAYGKVLVAQELVRKEESEVKKKAAEVALSNAIDMTLARNVIRDQ